MTLTARALVGWLSLSLVSALGSLTLNEANAAGVHGPALHFAAGFRMQKAPDLDTFAGSAGGFKFSLVSLDIGDTGYLSFAAPGIHYVGDDRVAGVFSPIIFNHASGVGFSVDFYTVSASRSGGPFGMSINIDPFGLTRFLSKD